MGSGLLRRAGVLTALAALVVGGLVPAASGSAPSRLGDGSVSSRLGPGESSQGLANASAEITNCDVDVDGLEDFNFDQFNKTASAEATCQPLDTVTGNATADMS